MLHIVPTDVFTPGKSASSMALVWTKYNVDLFWFGVVHTALFASEPETVNKTTHVLKVIHSLVHPFNRTRVNLEADRDHLFTWVLERLFGEHPSAIAVFTPCQKFRIQGGKLTWVRFNRTKQDTIRNPFNHSKITVMYGLSWLIA